MAEDRNIWDAIKATLDSYSTSLPIAKPGKTFDPPASGLWLRVMWFPNEPENITWAEDEEFVGAVRIGVEGYNGGGITALVDEAESIAALFPKSLALGPVRVRQRPYISPPISEGDKIMVPVTIPYRGIA